jgi:hypothetical protein
MAMSSFVSPFCEAKFCGVPACVFDKLGCAEVGKKVAEHCTMETRESLASWLGLHLLTYAQVHEIWV